VEASEDLLDLEAVGDGRIGHEFEKRGALEPDLTTDLALEAHPLVGQSGGGVIGERAQIDGGPGEIGRGVDRRHRDQAEPVVDVGEPFECLGHDLAQDLVDARRPRVGRRRPVVTPATACHTFLLDRDDTDADKA
jgi:hypothetical protein